jgi:hypothetical protein
VLHRPVVTTLLCNLLFGIAQGGNHSASGLVSSGGAGHSEPTSAAQDFSCATSRETANDVMTVQTALAGVPAILRLPKAIKKPPIVIWHGLGPPASESELMKALPLDDVPSVKVYLALPLFGARALGRRRIACSPAGRRLCVSNFRAGGRWRSEGVAGGTESAPGHEVSRAER